MKSLLLSGVAVFELLSHTYALSLANSNSKEGTLLLGFSQKRADVHPIPGSLDNRMRKRSLGSFETPLENRFTYYNIEIEFGTPPQQFNLLIDTGSSDTWVPDAANPHCATTKERLDQVLMDCTASGKFHTNESSTFHTNNTYFFMSYEDKSTAEGVWATDTFHLQNHTIENMVFGLNSLSNESLGVLGIGYETNQAAPFVYSNLPLRLVEDKTINTPAYSLWLNDVNSDEGNLLFGGVDHAKYSGELTKLPVLRNPTEDKPHELTIALTSLKMNSNGKTQELLDVAHGAVLDSGTSLSYFSQEMVDTIAQAFNASYEPRDGEYVTACNLTGSLDFDFAGAIISVDFSQMLLPLLRNKQPVYFNNGQAACSIGVAATESEHVVLGNTFLQSAYVVYDLQNHEIALGQCVYNSTDSDIEVISNTIPGAVEASNYSSTSVYEPSETDSVHTNNSTSSEGVIPTIILTRTSAANAGTPSQSGITTVRTTSGSASSTATASTRTSAAGAAPLVEIPFGSYLPSSTALLVGPMLIMLVFSAIACF